MIFFGGFVVRGCPEAIGCRASLVFAMHSMEAEIWETILVVLTVQKSLQYLPTKPYGILFMRHMSLYGTIAGQYSKRQLKLAVGRQETPRLLYGGEN